MKTQAKCPPPEIDYTPGDFWLKFAFAPEHLAKTITEPSSGKSSGKSSVKTPVKSLQLLLTNKSHHSTGKNKPLITRMNTDTKKWPRVHSLREWGRVKQKLCKQACKIFAFFCQSQLDGIIRAHLRNPWLVLLQPSPARGLLKSAFLFRAAQRLEIDDLGNSAHAPLVCGIAQQENPLAWIGTAGNRKRPLQLAGATIVDKQNWRA